MSRVTSKNILFCLTVQKDVQFEMLKKKERENWSKYFVNKITINKYYLSVRIVKDYFSVNELID